MHAHHLDYRWCLVVYHELNLSSCLAFVLFFLDELMMSLFSSGRLKGVRVGEVQNVAVDMQNGVSARSCSACRLE